MAANTIHIAGPYFALLPVPSPLTLFLIIAKRAKSIAITTTVMTQARLATKAEKMEPMKPAPRARRKAMKAMPQAIGWRIMASVSESAVSREALEK